MIRIRCTAFQILDILCDPRSAFALISTESCSIVLLLVVMLAFDMLLQGLELHRAATALTSAGAAVTPQTVKMIARVQIIYLLIQPLILVAKWAIIAFLLWLGAALSSAEIPFSRLFSLTVSLQAISTLHRSAQLVVALVSGASAAKTPADVGLNLLVHAGNATAEALLSLINPFSIWYAALMLLGVAYLTQRTAHKAVPIVLPYLGFVVMAVLESSLAVSGHI